MQRTDAFSTLMNYLSWLAAIVTAVVAWMAAPKIGISVLGQEITYLLCGICAAAVLYIVQWLKAFINWLR